MDIKEELLRLKDEKYKLFNSKLVPGIPLIGVRIPALRKLAKRVLKEDPDEAARFLHTLPHRYLEENHLHAFLIGSEKELERLIRETERFLPYIDNWQTCDSFLPGVFKKASIDPFIDKWLQQDRDYTKRYAIRLMMFRHSYTDRDIPKVIEAGDSPSYYVYMGAAWYLSLAAVENPAGVIALFKRCSPSDRLKEATCRKIRESRQFSRRDKLELQTAITG